MKKTLLMTTMMVIVGLGAMAQGRRMDPKEMVAREKQNIYKKITDLSKDQKTLIDGIYDELAKTMDENIKKMRNGDMPREKMRETMMKTRDEKDLLMADVLNKDQIKIYDELMAANKKRMEEMRKKRQQQGGSGGPNGQRPQGRGQGNSGSQGQGTPPPGL
ncbi:hypothetical protein [Reichenbachiella versicolor]|uniref:hypothetical protein n=1 Tax=Reichenbachiella versicolor TaxID=1821036 RepID=UPI000D6E4EC8|nr:hypothetical protein [Reichenbachiella versicolor]